MKNLKPLFIAAIALVLAFSCKKDELPKATQEGKGIMAAKINGKVWSKTACWSCVGGGSGLSAKYENNYLSIYAQEKTDNSNIAIEIYYEAPIQDSYIINGNQENTSISVFYFSLNKTYQTTANSTGRVIITKIDRTNRILSGTFSFKAENKDDPSDVISVTDGRFDVKYDRF